MKRAEDFAELLPGWATLNKCVALICKNEASETFLTELLGRFNWLFQKLQRSMQMVVLIIGTPTLFPQPHFVSVELWSVMVKKLLKTYRVTFGKNQYLF